MNLTVAATLTYRRHCPECMRAVEETVSAAIRDNQVTSLKLSTIPKCDHDAALAARAPGATLAPHPTPPPKRAAESLPLPLHVEGPAAPAALPNGFEVGA